jgi:hypothetical protein
MTKDDGWKPWVDVPLGWDYGFPKPLPDDVQVHDDIVKWVVAQGYPQSLVDFYGKNFRIRVFYLQDPETPKYTSGMREYDENNEVWYSEILDPHGRVVCHVPEYEANDLLFHLNWRN